MLSPIDLTDLVDRCAFRYDLKREVVASMVYQESGGNPLAFRFEPKFYERHIQSSNALSGYVPKNIPTLASEKIARAISFGLLQIMGETARSSLGFKNPFLSALLDPEINMDLGCRYLRKLLDNTHLSPGPQAYRMALTRYNGSPTYPDLIFDNIEKGRHLPFMPKGA